jgi:ribokinase
MAEMNAKGSRPRITVVGSFAVGLTMRAARFPVAGETLLGTDFDMGPGGKGSNQAVGSARLGAEVELVAVIGQDLFGDLALELYQRESVGITHLRRTAERNTGVGFITLNAAGENHIVLDMGANHLLSAEDVDLAEPLIARSDAVLSVLEINPATAAHGLRLARRHGAITILNPAPAQPLGDDLLSVVDVLTPNESELRILSGLPPDDPTDILELARGLLARGVRHLVVTRGSQGALVISASGDAAQAVAGVPVTVVDTTGAGDAFTCALGVALAEAGAADGASVLAAVRFAVYAGALACTRLGVVPALPTRAEVEALRQSRPG